MNVLDMTDRQNIDFDKHREHSGNTHKKKYTPPTAEGTVKWAETGGGKKSRPPL